jgi:hypothetical protein
VVPLWRDQPTGAVSGRASVNGAANTAHPNNVHPINGVNGTGRLNGANTGGIRRGRLDGRPPYADLLTPVHPTGTPPFVPPQPAPIEAVPVDSVPPASASVDSDSQTTLAGQQSALPAVPASPEDQHNVLHYGHYPPDGQGWPRSSDLPPGYQPMPRYPSAGQPGYPAADPTYAPEPTFPPQPSEPAGSEAPFVPAPALPSYPPSAVYPPSPTFPQASAYGPASAPYPSQPSYEDAAPLFDQHPPPAEPTIDWTMPSYPAQREPSDALTTDTPVRGTARPVPPSSEPPASVSTPQSTSGFLSPSSAPPSFSPAPPERSSSYDRSSSLDRPASLDRSSDRSALGGGAATQGGLPQRVPSEPDVPDLPGASVEPPHAAAPDLARIAAHLRHDDIPSPLADGRPDGFDIPAVIQAVRGVQGVREAKLSPKPGGGHMLRLELSDDADPGWVSRAVARLLNERMGLAAEPTPESAAAADAVTGVIASSADTPLPAETSRRHRPVSGAVRHAEPAGSAGLAGTLRPPQPFDPTSGAPLAPSAIPGVAGIDADTVVRRPEPPALIRPGMIHSPRVLIDGVDVRIQGVDAVVEVRLNADGVPAVGRATGLDIDSVVLRMAAEAAANAIDVLLVDPDTGARGRCLIEHAGLVPFGTCEVAVVVMHMNCDGWIEQLTGSSVSHGDPRSAMVRATLAAVNRRLEGLLP